MPPLTSPLRPSPGVSLHTSEHPQPGDVFVYDLSLRIWHWLVSACVLVLIPSGYFIRSPAAFLVSNPAWFLSLRSAHFLAGHVLAVSLVARAWWVFAGSTHAKVIYTTRLSDPLLPSDLLWQVKLYLHLTKEPRKLVGQNPLARLAMFSLFVFTGLFQAATGLALYGLGAGPSSWQSQVFGWVLPLFSSIGAVHSAHHTAMYVMVFFVVSHINAVFRAESTGTTTVLSTMFSGWRFERPPK